MRRHSTAGRPRLSDGVIQMRPARQLPFTLSMLLSTYTPKGNARTCLLEVRRARNGRSIRLCLAEQTEACSALARLGLASLIRAMATAVALCSSPRMDLTCKLASSRGEQGFLTAATPNTQVYTSVLEHTKLGYRSTCQARPSERCLFLRRHHRHHRRRLPRRVASARRLRRTARATALL